MSTWKRALAEAKYFTASEFSPLKLGNFVVGKTIRSEQYGSTYGDGAGTIRRESDDLDLYVVKNEATKEERRSVTEYGIAEALADLGIADEGWVWFMCEHIDKERYRNFRLVLRAHQLFERLDTPLKV